MTDQGTIATTFHERLKSKMDEFVHLIYRLTKTFPREELYGVTSQLRRAALSVVLNYIEGFACGNQKVNKNFLLISFGSLQETRYLIEFCLKEKYINTADHERAAELGKEIAAMLWGILKRMDPRR